MNSLPTRRVLDVMLTFDPVPAVRHLCAADVRLAGLIAQAGEFSPNGRRSASPFAALMRSVVYQQLSGKAAGTIHGRVLDLLPAEPEEWPRHVLALPDEHLRAAGVSRSKARAIKDLAARTLDGTVPTWQLLEEAGEDEIIARLTQVWGVGVWTVQMLLIFELGRPDILPTADLGVRRGCQLLYGLDAMPDVDALQRFAEPWRPYRSVASWYLWRAVDSNGF